MELSKWNINIPGVIQAGGDGDKAGFKAGGIAGGYDVNKGWGVKTPWGSVGHDGKALGLQTPYGSGWLNKKELQNLNFDLDLMNLS